MERKFLTGDYVSGNDGIYDDEEDLWNASIRALLNFTVIMVFSIVKCEISYQLWLFHVPKKSHSVFFFLQFLLDCIEVLQNIDDSFEKDMSWYI